MADNSNRSYVYRRRASFVWNYEKDEAWMTHLSAQGLHLDQPGAFRSRFEVDRSVRYVYQLDYQKITGKDQIAAYIALFEDAGWSYVGTCLGWYYFRRPYQEGETYEIYTDRASIKALYRRVQLMLAIVGLANLPLLLLNATNWYMRSAPPFFKIVIATVMGFEVAVMLLLAFGCLRFQQKIKALDETS